MTEELKRRAEERLAGWDGPATDLIRDLLAECERLTGANALFRARIAELEQRAPESCCCNPSRCTRACTPRGEWIERQRAEQPKFNQCAEVCERAKLCAICAGPISEQPKPEPVACQASIAQKEFDRYLTAPPAIPSGYALVPIDPTPEMIEAARSYVSFDFRKAWSAALAAAKVQP